MLVVIALLACGASASGELKAQQRPVTFGVVIDGPAPFNERLRVQLQGEVAALLSSEYRVQFPPELEITGDWTDEAATRALERLLADPAVDLVVALGVIATQAAARLEFRPKPVVAPLVVDAELQALPRQRGSSGTPNLTYAAVPPPGPVTRDLAWLFEVAPYSHVTVVIDRAYLASIPGLESAIGQAATAAGSEHLVIGADSSATEVLEALPDETALYLGLLPRMPVGEINRLLSGAVSRGTPTYAAMGEEWVERGALTSRVAADLTGRVAERAALQIGKILGGQRPESIPVLFGRGERPTINGATARAIGISPSWAVMTEAEPVDPTLPRGAQINLATAVRAAVARNPELASQDLLVEAGAQSVKGTRSGLLPQIQLGLDGRLIDSERAESHFGREPERALIGSLELNQVLYSDRVWADYDIEKRLQDSRVQRRDEVRLDLVLETATTYLEVLKTRDLVGTFRDNLRVTRNHLELALLRTDEGRSSPGESSRWQSEMDRGRQQVIAADSRHAQAVIALNRIVSQPLEQSFRPDEESAADVAVLAASPRLQRYLTSAEAFRLFRDFMAQEALIGSPELRRADAAMAAQSRELTAATRAWFLPDLALSASLSDVFAEGGAGTDPIGPALTVPNDRGWALGLSLSYPVFTGLSRPAAQGKARLDLADLGTRRQAVADRVEQRVRSAMHAMGASYARNELARRRAETAAGNLELVAEAYAGGSGDIASLIDAQETALRANIDRVDSAYDFLVDLMEVERAVGSFSFFLTRAERADFLDRLDAFAAAARGGER